MNTAVTGASGHIGANLIRSLSANSHSVRLLKHHRTRALEDLDIPVIKGDLFNKASLAKLCEGVEVVFHLAAQISIGNFSMDQLLHVNVEGTKNVIRACRDTGVKRLVHFSSIHALSHEPLSEPMTEKNLLAVGSRFGYEKIKALAEQEVMQTAHGNNLEIIVLNPTAVLGPYDFAPSYLGQFLIRLYQHKIPGLVPGGYDWVDVRDVVKAAITAAKSGRNGERYILSGHWVNLRELAETASIVTGKNLHPPMLPGWIANIGLPFIQTWVKIRKEHPLYTRESLQILKLGNRDIRHDKATRELEYHPRPLEETLRDGYDWFRMNGYL